MDLKGSRLIHCKREGKKQTRKDFSNMRVRVQPVRVAGKKKKKKKEWETIQPTKMKEMMDGGAKR